MQSQIIEGYALSPQQKRLWRLLSSESRTAYIASALIRLEGPIEETELRGAVVRAIERYEILQTMFRAFAEMTTPLQVPGAPAAVWESPLDLQGLERREADAALDRWRRTLGEKEFDLANGPLVRLGIAATAPDARVLYIGTPALCADVPTLKLVAREIARQLNAGQLEEGLRYALVADWLNELLASEEHQAGRAYWRSVDAALFEGVDVPCEKRTPGESGFAFESVSLWLPDPILVKFEACAKQHQISLPTFFLSAWQMLSARLSGKSRTVVGTAFTGRTDRELELSAGPMTRFLPICAFFQAQDRGTDVMARTEAACDEALVWQECFVWEVAAAGTMTEIGYFPFCFEFTDLEIEEAQGRIQLQLEKAVAHPDRFHLKLSCSRERGGVRMDFHYDPTFYSREDAQRTAESYQSLLDQLVARPESRWNDLEVVGEHERRQLAKFNRTEASYPRDVSIPELFQSQVERTPDSPAVLFEEQAWTYSELNRRANQIAHYLRRLGAGPETKVALYVERSLEMAAALMGTLKAGAAYIPVDPGYPEERIAFLLADSGAELILTQEKLAGRLPAHRASRVIALDLDWPTIANESTENPTPEAISENLAYILYTSGSTGRPKGVMISAGALVNHMFWMLREFPLTAEDCVLQKTPFSFDASVWEFFAPWLSGARLAMARPDGHKFADYLAAAIQTHRVTTLQLVPTLLGILLDEPSFKHCHSLKRVFCGGEPLPLALVERFHAAMNAELYNLYGPTEATIDATYFHCRPSGQERSVLIGRPVSNTQAYLLDEQLRLAPIGAAGELYLSGDNLARGYLKRPDLTAKNFIPNPWGPAPGARMYRTGDIARYRPDGLLDYISRIDHQVKIRGALVELAEVEDALRRCQGVKDAIVLALDDAQGEKRLIAYVITEDIAAATAAEFRRRLLEKLPDYMIPANFIQMTQFPVTPSGKLDRRALPAPDASRPSLDRPYVAPRNDEEELLAVIWAQVLGVEQVGVHDNFFALGGDSIRCVRVVSMVKERGLDCSVQKLFEHQTIAELAAHLDETALGTISYARSAPFELISESDRLKVPADVEDAYPLTMLQLGMLYHMDLASGAPIYHNVSSWRLRGRLDPEVLNGAVQRAVRRHANLRTYFDLVSYREPLQLVRKSAFLPVQVEDLQALAPKEQKAVIDEYTGAESRRFFDPAEPPLLRLCIHRLDPDVFQFTLTEFHPIFDGWSLTSTLAEIFQDYFARLSGEPLTEAPPPQTSFRDYVKMERAALESDECRRYWEEKLTGCQPLLLPRWPSMIAGHGGPRMHHKMFTMEGEELESLLRCSRLAGVPFKHVLLASHIKTLNLISGQSDILTGLSANNTRPEEADGDQVRGLFINTAPFRLQLQAGSWIDLARECFALEWELQPYKLYPLAAIQQKWGRERLIETSFNFVHFHSVKPLFDSGDLEIAGPGAAVELSSFTTQINFSLAPIKSMLKAALSCDAAQIYEGQAQAMADCYRSVLSAIALNPYADHSLFQTSEFSAEGETPAAVELGAIDAFAGDFSY